MSEVQDLLDSIRAIVREERDLDAIRAIVREELDRSGSNLPTLTLEPVVGEFEHGEYSQPDENGLVLLKRAEQVREKYRAMGGRHELAAQELPTKWAVLQVFENREALGVAGPVAQNMGYNLQKASLTNQPRLRFWFTKFHPSGIPLGNVQDAGTVPKVKTFDEVEQLFEDEIRRIAKGLDRPGHGDF